MSWTQRGQDIDGETANDQSGFSVSFSSDGTIVAIGAPGNNAYKGQVRVYSWNGLSWIQRGQDIDEQADYGNSGYSVSLSSDGTIVAIGAPYSGKGQVRVYSWNGSSWIQRGQDINGEAADDESGTSVSLSSNGNIVAIGAPRNNGTGYIAGQVRVYSWNDLSNNWIKRGQDIDGEANALSGSSVSLSSDGNIVAIGAPNTAVGQVRVYSWNGLSWIQRGQDIDGEAAGDDSGYSVSLSSDGNIVAIGAPYNDGGKGQVRVYSWNDLSNNWIQRGQDIDGEAANDSSGWSVSLSSNGNIVAIGAPYNDGSNNNAGQVRVYSWNDLSNNWIQRGQDIDGEAVGDNSGYSVSLSSNGNIVAIGAPYNGGTGNNAGQVRVYQYQQQQPPTITNFSIPSKVYGDIPFNIVDPSSNSTGAFTYTSSNTSVSTISGNTVTIVGAGTSVITASQAATANYTSGDASANFVVSQATPENPINVVDGEELLYFLNTSAIYGNIDNSIEVSSGLSSSTQKILFNKSPNNVTITRTEN